MVSLTEPSEDGHGVVGPGPGLRKYCQTQNLRVIGELHTNIKQILQILSNIYTFWKEMYMGEHYWE